MRRKKDEVARARVLNQELAHLIAYAYHKPGDMPDLTKAQVPQTEEHGLNVLRAGLLQWKIDHDRAIACQL